MTCEHIYAAGYESSVPAWHLKTKNDRELCDGVLYSERLYVGDDGLPYRVFMLKADPKKVDFYAGTCNDGYKYALEDHEKANVMQHMEAALAGGIDVIAGTNANHFDIDGDHHPLGLCVKNGKLVSPGMSTRPYFAITKDRKFLMGANGTEVDPSTLEMAVSGSFYIVHDSLPMDLRMDDDIGYTPHPRTLVGIKADGTIIMAVVDGRAPAYSNGASLAKCAALMIAEGAVQASNLDGGGSSTFIVRENDSFKTKNLPSDGDLRKLSVSLLVVKKK